MKSNYDVRQQHETLDNNTLPSLRNNINNNYVYQEVQTTLKYDNIEQQNNSLFDNKSYNVEVNSMTKHIDQKATYKYLRSLEMNKIIIDNELSVFSCIEELYLDRCKFEAIKFQHGSKIKKLVCNNVSIVGDRIVSLPKTIEYLKIINTIVIFDNCSFDNLNYINIDANKKNINNYLRVYVPFYRWAQLAYYKAKNHAQCAKIIFNIGRAKTVEFYMEEDIYNIEQLNNSNYSYNSIFENNNVDISHLNNINVNIDSRKI